ncbi:Anaerobilin reductase [Escherichia coli]|nr:Anaerobilin reductase [Escherichia coli]
MTPWLLFGAGGKGVGARTLELALAEQRPVVAVIRHADAATKLAQQGVQVFTGDACDASVVAAACRAAGPDALIISTMGGAQDYLAHRTVIDEAEKAGISRMILVTSLGCGDSWYRFYQSGQRLRLVRRYGKKRWRKAGCKPASLIMPFSALAVCLMVRQRAKHNGYKIRSVMVLLTVLMSPHISMNWQMRQHLTSRSTV